MAQDKKTKRWADEIARSSASSYANLVTGATAGNFASLTATGDLSDSGHKDADYADASHDHGTSHTGLTDDDHTQYLKEKAAGGLASEVPTHTHADAANAGTVDHGALTGLADDDHTRYVDKDGTRDIVQAGEWRVGDGTNYAQFASDGEITLAGTARVWKTRIIKPEGVKLPGLNPPASDNIDGFSFLRYNRGTEESVYYIFVLPGDFAAGTASVRGHYGFVVDHPPTAPSPNEAVVMGFEYKKLSDGDVFDFGAGTSSVTITETIVADETAGIIHETSDGYPDTTGWAPRDKILFRFYRDATNVNDTYDNEAAADDNDVWVFDYYLEYLSNGIGKAS